jgi:LacI family transcriptional regulator
VPAEINPDRRPTLKDVALEAGVSVSMVSHVLNNYPSIREETRKRVWAAKEKLDYQPNQAARQLRRQSANRAGGTRNLALVILENPPACVLTLPLIDVFSRDLHARDLHPLVLKLPATIESERDLPASLRNRGVDGVILTGDLSSRCLELFGSLNLPYVVVGNEEPSPKCTTVKPDVSSATADGMKALFALGHTRIGFVTEQLDTCYHREILAAFRQAYERRGLPLREEWIQASGRVSEGGIVPMKRLLQAQDVPTAILFTNVRIAANGLEMLRQHHLDVPGDMRLLAFSGTVEVEIRPEIDRIIVDYEVLGLVAIKALLDRIADPLLPGLTIGVPCSVSVG